MQDLWTHQCIALWSGSFQPICWPQGISKEFHLWLTPADPCMICDPSNELHFDQGFFLPNLVAIPHLAIRPLIDPGWLLHDLWPQQSITLWSGILPTKFGGHRALLSKLTPTWPQLTPIPHSTPAMHYSMVRVLPTKFGGHRVLPSKLTPDDSSWPLHDLWPQQRIMLWSGILPTKFGGHRTFLSNLTPGWPQMTPTWPLTPAMNYRVLTTGQGFYSPNLVAKGHF